MTALLVVSGVVTGCGPSDSELRTDVGQVCARLTRDLSRLEAEPEFRALRSVAGDASDPLLFAAMDIEDVSTDGEYGELASALRSLSTAFEDLESQLAERDYASLSETQTAGETAATDVLSAAEAVGGRYCPEVLLPTGLFTIAAEGARAALDELAPTGDYVTDADAACGRFAVDTMGPSMRLRLGSLLRGETHTASDYLQAVEDRAAIGAAIERLTTELSVLEPPAGAEAAHAEIIAGYRLAREGARELDTQDGLDLYLAGAEQVAAAAGQLGVSCGL